MPELPRNNFAGQVSTRLGRVSLNPRGEYAEGETYDRLDIVQYNGSGWICLKDSTTGVAPVEGDNWMRFADNGGAATVEAAQEYAEQAKASQTAAGESATQAQTAQEAAETARDEAAAASNTAEEKAAEAAESAQSAKDYSGKPPQIGEDGNWETWDAEMGEYKTTGKPSRGEKGDKGEPGKDGTGAGDMTSEVYDPGGKATDIFGYVDSAVENVKLPANLVVSKEEEEPPAVLTVDADTLGGYGPDHYASTEYVDEAVANVKPSGDFLPKQDPEFEGRLFTKSTISAPYVGKVSHGMTITSSTITGYIDGEELTFKNYIRLNFDGNRIEWVRSGEDTGRLQFTDNSGETFDGGINGVFIKGVATPRDNDNDSTAANKKYVDSRIQSGTAAPESLDDGVVYLVYEE